MSTVSGSGAPGILTLNIQDKSSLYAAYMPYVKNGGLFIPTTRPHKLGDEVFALVTLVEQNERLPVAGKVIWITPPGAQGKRTPGIGIQFSTQDNGETQKKIETIIAGMREDEHFSHTM
mgnify:CR=1 FL=1